MLPNQLIDINRTSMDLLVLRAFEEDLDDVCK